MTFDPAKLQPLLDMLLKSGDETSEFKQHLATSRFAAVMFVVGLALEIVSSTVGAFAGSNYAQIAGMVVMAAAPVVKLLSQAAYTKSRVDIKAVAGETAQAIATALKPPVQGPPAATP